MNTDWIVPAWAPHPAVRALVTTRVGGTSAAPFDTMNVGVAVGDAPAAVALNRARLAAHLPAPPRWLTQVHGTGVVRHVAAATPDAPLPQADAAWTTDADVVCVVQMADCLPVLLAADDGSAVAAAHAGWRGLAAGVLEATIDAMSMPPARLHAWLGPAIGPDRFEVGDDVRDAFTAADPGAAIAFRPGDRAGKWWADLFVLARRRLAHAGIAHVAGGGTCTASDPARFFSHRRDGTSGRMAACIWRAGSARA
ncbi:MAG: peptidoglycan editing factor PgeF [Burkholderiales bacterium]|nr:peptidoglycan editing factor PgeF [Burkholderiales bacterium]